jgi:hypothetical protein
MPPFALHFSRIHAVPKRLQALAQANNSEIAAVSDVNFAGMFSASGHKLNPLGCFHNRELEFYFKIFR